MKVLGMCFSNKPTMEAHVQWLQSAVRRHYWTLKNLKLSGFSEEELVRVYTTTIRPVLDYGAVIYHSSLTDQQDEGLERQQNHMLKCIFGAEESARKLRQRAGLTSLRERRIELADKLAAKLVTHPRFEHHFPLKEVRASRRGVPEKYLEFPPARCD